MEPNELVRYVVGLLAIVALGAVALVGYMLLRSARRRTPTARGTPAVSEQPAESPSPAPLVVKTARPAPKPRPAQPPTLPELVSEAADTPQDERLINAAASTMQTLPEGVKSAVWVAVVPRQFNAPLISALRPDWASRAHDIDERLRRLWFVSSVPDGSCVQSVIRRAMLHHLYRKAEQREDFLLHSLRAAKYYHARMLASSDAYNQRNARFVTDTFFRFRPPNCQSPEDEIEWLYHLAVADPVSAQPALVQMGDEWLAADHTMDLQNLLDALREHIDDSRLSRDLTTLAYYYAGCVALRGNRVRDALSALSQARQLSANDPAIISRIYEAIGAALDVLTSPDRFPLPDGSVWSSLRRPIADRAHWGLWADLHLPQPGDDELRRTQEMLNVYEGSHNLSGAALAMRLIGDAHRARGDYRYALEWYQKSRATLQQSARDEGEHQSHMLDEAITLKAVGDTLYLMGRAEDALRTYDESLQAHYRLPGDELSEADAHKAKGDVLHFLGRYVDALPEYEIALAAYRQGGAAISEGEALLAQGRLLQALHRQEEAQRCFDEALGIYRRCGSYIGEANALLVMGSSAQLRGQSLPAVQQFEGALRIYRAQKNEAGEAAALKALGDARTQLGQIEQAVDCYTEALTQFERAGLRRNIAETELALGQLRLRERSYEDASTHYAVALQQFRDIQDRRGEADARLAMGEVRHLQRQNDEAIRLWTEALTTYRETRDRFGEAQTVSRLGDECLLQKDYAGALTNYELALNLWQEMGDPVGAVELMYGQVGHCLALLNRLREAVRAFEHAAEMRTQRQFGWLGWRAVVEAHFEDALVHFTAMANRDPAVKWQVGLALATLAKADRTTAENLMEAALRRADADELGEACRWIEYVARVAPDLNLKAEQFSLMC